MTSDFNRSLRTTASCVLLVACARLPVEPVTERLDTTTGTTVAVVARPLELVAEQSRGTSRDPFAYIAPFEINRMGTRTRYLWVAAPQDDGPITQPEVLCGARRLELPAVAADVRLLGLSRAPYDAPSPWSGQWYFHLSDDALSCLAQTGHISIAARGADGRDERFSAEASRTTNPLAEFVSRMPMGQ